ncbi:hypothetical protein Hypma_003328 [Hypsizygus marmoreus]|uniref:Uncharacterized protein n=1 Tax=Hypsizygus marmoreus TaxID=39966 RepID=A0A369J2H7_HYPMA|nr:hypothetical protein Hypma_003328 [Hypsizygus marmoreus]
MEGDEWLDLGSPESPFLPPRYMNTLASEGFSLFRRRFVHFVALRGILKLNVEGSSPTKWLYRRELVFRTQSCSLPAL